MIGGNGFGRGAAMAVLLMTTGLCSVAMTGVAQAQSASGTQRNFDIAAQPLPEALVLFGRQSGLQITAAAEMVGGRQGSAVSGDMSAGAALSRLLAGTGLTFKFTNANTVTIERAPQTADGAVQLGPVRVEGSTANTSGSVGIATSDADASEGTGAYTALGATRTATGLALTLQETPQSITVVTRQKMDDENIRTLQDIAMTATGLSYGQLGSERPYFYSRGFQVYNLQYDGMMSSLSTQTFSQETLSTDNMAIYDRVEIVRGATGLLQGAGTPSGSINMVRKRPTEEAQISGEVGIGSWKDYRGQVDISVPLTATGNIRARAVAYYNDRDSFRDYQGKENRLLYAVGEANLNDSTMIAIGGSIQKDDNQGYDWTGFPVTSASEFYGFSRSKSLAAPSNYLNKDNKQLFIEVEHNFSEDWNVKLRSNYRWSDSIFNAAYLERMNDENYYVNTLYTEYFEDQKSYDVAANGKIHLFGRDHEVRFGGNYNKSAMTIGLQGWSTQSWTSASLINIYNPVFITPTFSPTMTNWDLDYVQVNMGIYGAANINISDRVKLVTGGRISWYRYSVEGVRQTQANAQITPYAGLVYDLNSQNSIYISYTDIFNPQSSYGLDGALLAPVIGSNYELGWKGAFFEGRLNASAAIFQVDQTNLAVALTDSLRICGPTGTSTCYRASGKVRNQGFELELSGELAPGLNTTFGYTHSDPEESGVDINTMIPRDLLKISADWRLPGAWSRLRLGGNAYWQSKITATQVEQKSYAIFNVHAAYHLSERVNVTANLNNVLDKTYYNAIGDNDGGNFFGTPRSISVTLRAKY